MAYYAAMINPFAQPHELVLVTSTCISRWRWGWPFASFRGWAALNGCINGYGREDSGRPSRWRPRPDSCAFVAEAGAAVAFHPFLYFRF